MAGARRTIVIFLLVLVALILLSVLAGGWMVWKRPLTLDRWSTRADLGKAGLEKDSLELSTGTLAYWQGGKGETVALLHGLGDHAGTWKDVVPALLKRYRVLVPDMPGHADSDPKDGPLSIGTVKTGALEMIESLNGGDPVVVVGNSMGAWVGSLLALERPDLVSRLILVNGGGKTAPGEAVSLVPGNRKEARDLMDLLRSPDSPPVPAFVLDDIIRRAGRGPIARVYQAADTIEAFLLDDRLEQIGIPVDMLWGADDGFMTVGYARSMAEEIPASRVTEIPSCGHIPHRECPVVFTSALLKVLEQDPPEPDLSLMPDEAEPTEGMDPFEGETE